jgi:hypothetical protein
MATNIAALSGAIDETGLEVLNRMELPDGSVHLIVARETENYRNEEGTPVAIVVFALEEQGELVSVISPNAFAVEGEQLAAVTGYLLAAQTEDNLVSWEVGETLTPRVFVSVEDGDLSDGQIGLAFDQLMATMEQRFEALHSLSRVASTDGSGADNAETAAGIDAVAEPQTSGRDHSTEAHLERPASSSTLSLSPTTPIAFIATVKQIHDTGSPQATTARKVLELFGAKRRGAQVVSLIEAALAQGYLTTFPDISTAPLDSPLELRLAHGVAAGQYSLDIMGVASTSGEMVSVVDVPSSPAKPTVQELASDERKDKEPEKPVGEAVGGPEPSDTGREFWEGKSSAASMEALDFVLEILREKVSDVDLVYQKYRIHPRSGQHICRLIRLTPQKSALMIQLTMPETEYWSKRLGREGMNARFLERDGFYRLNATLESARSHRLLWREVLFHLWDGSTGDGGKETPTESDGVMGRVKGLFGRS